MLKKVFIFILLMYALGYKSIAQGKLSYNIEAGTLVSIGKNKYVTALNINNTNTSLSYANVLRFSHPSFRLRNSILYNASESCLLGIGAGITVHYMEPFYSYQMLFSFPLFSHFQYNIYPINPKYTIISEAGVGYHFMNISNQGMEEKGGLILHAGLGVNLKATDHVVWKASAGFEQQTEQLNFTFPPEDPNQPQTHFKAKRLRNQIYFTIGISLK